jgi:hypothetical protein
MKGKKMNRMCIFVVLITIIITHTGVASSSSDYDAYISIKPDKKEYIIGEPIWIEMEIENFGENGPPMMNRLLAQSLCVVQLDDHNKKQYNLRIERNYGNLPKMERSDKIHHRTEIIEDYGIYLHSSPRLGLKLLPRGEYLLYANPHGIMSDTVRIEIIESKGVEKQAFKMFHKISEDMSRIPKHGNEELVALKKVEGEIIELLLKYPDSVYGPTIIKDMTTTLWISDSPKSDQILFNLAKEFYERFPKHEYISSIILDEIKTYGPKDVKGQCKALNRIIENNYSEIATKAAKDYLKMTAKKR